MSYGRGGQPPGGRRSRRTAVIAHLRLKKRRTVLQRLPPVRAARRQRHPRSSDCRPNRSDPAAKAVVVDYKDSEQAAGPHFKLQVGAYALLIEEVWSIQIEAGWIYHLPLRKAEKVAISPQLRRNVIEAINAIQQAIRTEALPPPPSSRALCVNCEFRRFCNDVV
ncbi:CRISPR-associated protein Cas4 [Chloroflexus sp.]|uniref:CRISPR-associated protein Cas4 n=1 Tax=Chloroflexus sp. TaxID=1904827 RepID=UPI002ACEB229|nr:CRISPR-associated protein Cas4 [Chloroflexus sp.]